jgi:hypothetical protein
MARPKGSRTGRCQGCNHIERVRIERLLAEDLSCGRDGLGALISMDANTRTGMAARNLNAVSRRRRSLPLQDVLKQIGKVAEYYSRSVISRRPESRLMVSSREPSKCRSPTSRVQQNPLAMS